MSNLEKMASFPLVLLFFAIAAMSWGGVSVSGGFLGYVIMGLVFLMLGHLLDAHKIKVGKWFQNAGMFALLAAAFTLVDPTFLDVNNWAMWFVEISVLLAWVFAAIGALTGIFSSR